MAWVAAEMWAPSSAWCSGLKDLALPQWHRSPLQSCILDSLPGLAISMCHEWGQRRKKSGQTVDVVYAYLWKSSMLCYTNKKKKKQKEKKKEMITVILEKCLAVSQMVQHRITVWPGNSTARYIPKRNRGICPRESLYTNIQSGNKMWPSCKTILFSHKVLIHATAWVPLKTHCA